MRSEQEMFGLIIGTARQHERVRAVIMNGSRADANARRDLFQGFDIVYVVTEVEPFEADRSWVNRFGEIMIMQTPEEIDDPPLSVDAHKPFAKPGKNGMSTSPVFAMKAHS